MGNLVLARSRRSLLAWNGPLIGGLGVALALTLGLLLAVSPLPELLVLVVLLSLTAATLAEPLVGVVAGVFCGLLRAYLQAEVPQVPAQAGHLFVAMAVAAWLARGLAMRDLRLLPPFKTTGGLPGDCASSSQWPVALALLGFIGLAWVSLWNGADLANYGLPELVKWIEILVVFLLVAARARPRHLPWLIGAVALVGLFQAGVGLYQSVLRGEGPEHFLIPGMSFYRAYGTFEQPNPYAGAVGMILALLVGVLGDALSRFRTFALSRFRVFTFFSLIPLILALVASWSRGAWIGFAAAVAVMALALPRKAHWGLLLLAALIVLAVALYGMGLIPSAIAARLTGFIADLQLEDVRGVGINDANYAVVERLAHWQSALEMWRSNFWTGVGLGCYEPAYPQYALANWPIALGHAHNFYLNLLAETGLLGLFGYLVFWGVVFGQTWRATRCLDGLARGVAVGLLGAWTQLSVHHLLDNLYVNNVHLLIGMLLGLLVAAMATCREA